MSVAKLTEWRSERARRRGVSKWLKERERDDREDEIARLKSKVGEISWTTNCCPPRPPP